MTTEVPTLDQLNAELLVELGKGTVDDAKVSTIIKARQKFTQDIVKVQATKDLEEANALAGDREKLASKILKVLSTLPEARQLAAVKATGFAFKLPYEDNNGVATKEAVLLTVPTIKKSGGGGGGGTGESVKNQTGLTRSELITKYATDEEKATIAKSKDEATGRGGNPNSSGWSAEKPVVKRILKDNPSLIH